MPGCRALRGGANFPICASFASGPGFFTPVMTPESPETKRFLCLLSHQCGTRRPHLEPAESTRTTRPRDVRTLNIAFFRFDWSALFQQAAGIPSSDHILGAAIRLHAGTSEIHQPLRRGDVCSSGAIPQPAGQLVIPFTIVAGSSSMILLERASAVEGPWSIDAGAVLYLDDPLPGQHRFETTGNQGGNVRTLPSSA